MIGFATSTQDACLWLQPILRVTPQKVPAEMLSKGPAIGIIAATYFRGHDKAQRLAAVEIVRGGGDGKAHKDRGDKPRN